MRGDTRAVSPAVTQALTIGISTILITGLLLGGSSFVDTKRENTVRQGLQDIGAGVASDLVRLDQFETSTAAGSISFTSRYPDRIGGENYLIRLLPGPDRTSIYINSTSSDLGTVIRFENETNVCGGRTAGGEIAVVYDASTQCLAVRDP
jgi:hypothetical protein